MRQRIKKNLKVGGNRMQTTGGKFASHATKQKDFNKVFGAT